jgi:hypothetical protein
MNNTDKILSSIDQLKRAEAPDYFYAGIRAKMQREQKNNSVTGFTLKPAYAMMMLAAFLIINISVLSVANKKAGKTEDASGTQAFAREYNLTTQTFGQ